MSRYTDYDAIDYKNYNMIGESQEFMRGVVYMAERIEEAPTIEIIRCGECKYWKSTVQMPNGTEVKCLYGRKPDDFCSYGSRSEKPNNCETCKWWEEDTSFCYSKADSDDHACHYERSSE